MLRSLLLVSCCCLAAFCSKPVAPEIDSSEDLSPPPPLDATRPILIPSELSSPPPPMLDLPVDDEVDVELGRAIGEKECADVYSVFTCMIYKERGQCTLFFLKEKCAKTCDSCPVDEPQLQPRKDTDCVDKLPFCESYNLHGFCRSKSKRDFMMMNCQKTCNMCTGVKAGYDGRCGNPAVPLEYLFSRRIVDGSDAAHGSVPWQGAIYVKKTKKLICGASLIDARHLLTAAHCFVGAFKPDDYLLFLGKHHRSYLLRDAGDLEVHISSIVVHERFSWSTFAHDIAMVRLTAPVAYTAHIRPVCLPTKTLTVVPGRAALVSGFGVTDPRTGATPEVLQKVGVVVIARGTCRDWMWKHRRNRDMIKPGMICAGHAKGDKDSCQGDSGGPLVVYEGGQHFLVGIVSWGISCALTERPGVYTKVTNYLDWIAKNSK